MVFLRFQCVQLRPGSKLTVRLAASGLLEQSRPGGACAVHWHWRTVRSIHFAGGGSEALPLPRARARASLFAVRRWAWALVLVLVLVLSRRALHFF